jgi:hypothetical protein
VDKKSNKINYKKSHPPSSRLPRAYICYIVTVSVQSKITFINFVKCSHGIQMHTGNNYTEFLYALNFLLACNRYYPTRSHIHTLSYYFCIEYLLLRVTNKYFFTAVNGSITRTEVEESGVNCIREDTSKRK